MISSITPIRSLLSLKTAFPSSWRFALQPRVSSRNSAPAIPGCVDPATYACAIADVIYAMLASTILLINILQKIESLPLNCFQHS